ncbi:hypothetical protein [Deinococcus apachensis]|uniref:hypothetical protein n=1 Tax=Deinococcus apachensis TaxID=309886 RepID=UPI00039E8435|nr:hypothetical protein [Deinococcus apachensis]
MVSLSLKPRPYLFHPETGEPLSLPETYLEEDGRLILQRASGGQETIYRGRIFLRSIGQNLASGEQYLEVQFDRRGGQHTVTAPRRDLATPGGLIDHLAPVARTSPPAMRGSWWNS